MTLGGYGGGWGVLQFIAHFTYLSNPNDMGWVGWGCCVLLLIALLT